MSLPLPPVPAGSANDRLTIGQAACLACLLEAAAPKPGNVHRGADFADLSFVDFVASAVATAPILESAAATGVGAAVLAAVATTRRWVQTNTNLGMVLLLAPLAAVPGDVPLADGIHAVLRQLGPEDSRLVYAAIRLAQPGGLGHSDAMDVRDEAPADLLAAMEAAAPRDLVARQYSNGFVQVFTAAQWLVEARRRVGSLTDSIIYVQQQLLADFPDTLIARKCGEAVARTASQQARHVLSCGAPGEPEYQAALADFDFWLRSDGHRRNPGTTADVIAAALFVALRERLLEPPYR